MFKKSYQISFIFLLLCALGVTALANNSADGVWQETDDTNLKSRPLERMVVPASYKSFRINAAALNSILEKAPMEFTEAARNTELILNFPDARRHVSKISHHRIADCRAGIACEISRITNV